MPTVSTSPTDPLLETQVFWVRYRTQILAVLAALVVGTAIWGAYRFYKVRQDAAAAQLLATAKMAPDFQKIMDAYPSSAAAPSAALLLAAQQREQRQFADANATLQTFVKKYPNHQLVSAAKMAMAANLESLGKTDEALEMYRRTAADHAQSYNAPMALLAQVPLLKQQGKIEDARRVCETVLTQYRESYASAEASQLLRSLKPTPAAAPAAPPAASTPEAPTVAPAPASPETSVAPSP